MPGTEPKLIPQCTLDGIGTCRRQQTLLPAVCYCSDTVLQSSSNLLSKHQQKWHCEVSHGYALLTLMSLWRNLWYFCVAIWCFRVAIWCFCVPSWCFCGLLWCFCSFSFPNNLVAEMSEWYFSHLVSWFEYHFDLIYFFEDVHWIWPPVLWSWASWEECHVSTILFTLQVGIVMHPDGDILAEVHLVVANEVSWTCWFITIW